MFIWSREKGVQIVGRKVKNFITNLANAIMGSSFLSFCSRIPIHPMCIAAIAGTMTTSTMFFLAQDIFHRYLLFQSQGFLEPEFRICETINVFNRLKRLE